MRFTVDKNKVLKVIEILEADPRLNNVIFSITTEDVRLCIALTYKLREKERATPFWITQIVGKCAAPNNVVTLQVTFTGMLKRLIQQEKTNAIEIQVDAKQRIHTLQGCVETQVASPLPSLQGLINVDGAPDLKHNPETHVTILYRNDTQIVFERKELSRQVYDNIKKLFCINKENKDPNMDNNIEPAKRMRGAALPPVNNPVKPYSASLGTAHPPIPTSLPTSPVPTIVTQPVPTQTITPPAMQKPAASVVQVAAPSRSIPREVEVEEDVTGEEIETEILADEDIEEGTSAEEEAPFTLEAEVEGETKKQDKANTPVSDRDPALVIVTSIYRNKEANKSEINSAEKLSEKGWLCIAAVCPTDTAEDILKKAKALDSISETYYEKAFQKASAPVDTVDPKELEELKAENKKLKAALSLFTK